MFSLEGFPWLTCSLQTMDTASRVVTEEARNVFSFGLVFDDQMFGLSIVASGRLEEDREKHTGSVASPDSTILFHLLNRGLWDQQLVDAPQEPLDTLQSWENDYGGRLL